ncbi:tetratricopeptide repeat protein [uncultured Croceitalea sp.]|uniref:tetratricopeptide repeat protein n=1 Tax=uncultured Croceitalea sp. TaxID=1798908 RepID=UPI0033055C29
MNRRTTAFLFLIFLGFSLLCTAQETKIYSHEQKQFQDALALYNNQQYQASQALFEKVKSTTNDYETEANSSYYAANAAIRLNQRGADKLMEDFVERYPTSTKRNSAFMDVADYYFETGKYPYALKWYKKVDKTAMAKSDEERFNFNNGYALYASKKPKEAERYLSRVNNSKKYGSQAKYYLGYVAYEQDDYDEASARFDKITDPKLLEEKLSYYQADLNFKLGNFEKAIEMAKKQLPKSDRREISELNKIIGESYFNLEKYDEAIPYLKQYRGKRGRFNNTDYYLLGYSYYKKGDFESAIGQFNKIIGGDNSVAQNAYYHLAECYLKLDKKPEALNAFRNASQMDFNPEIEKDALLNYARLSYEIGNAYEPVPQVMTTYLEKYPKDEHQEELQELLVDSYITSKNFDGAMELLEKNASYASDETYQKVAFYSGVELFVDTNYEDALERFSKSLKKAENPIYEARSQYWKAESAYRLNRFDDALVAFEQFKRNPSANKVPEYSQLDYNLGYCYFKLKDYKTAVTYFKNVPQSAIDEERKNDAYLRLGDSYFVTSNYKAAITAYDASSKLNGPERDYAAFQKAICSGFIGNNTAKIDGLNQFINRYPKSILRDDALFELGNTYVKTDKEAQGLASYDKLINQFSKSKFAPRAMLRQGLVHYNANRNEQALTKLKSVVKEYPNTQEAKQAVATAKLVYVDLGRVSEYAAWVRNLDFVEVTDSELDAASFEAADRKYAQGNTAAAIRGYEDYLKEFPNGSESIKANFNLAQLYFSKGDKEKALAKFRNVTESGAGDYAEQALTRVCEIYVGRQDYQSAIPYLKQLEGVAEIVQNRTFAQSNLMKGYYGQKNYEQTLAYAEKVLNAPKIDNRIKSDAQIMIARSAIETGDEQRAETAFAEVKKIATGETAAEAWYYDAYFKNKNQDFEASNTSVQKLAKDYASYKEWGGKGLVLMAKNFYALGDAFQATYILDSVIENFSEFNDIVAEAKGELSLIKAREAEINSSVNPNEN